MVVRSRQSQQRKGGSGGRPAAPEKEKDERMRDGRRLSKIAKITAAAVLAVMAAAGPAEAVCELLASGAAGITGLRIGSAIGARMGIAAGGTAIAGTWPVGLTLGSLLATGTGVVLLATPAVCLALASAAGATTLAAVALAAGVTAAGAAIVVLIIENEYARGVIGRAVDKLKEAGRAGFPWALQLFNGATLEAARLETTPKPFVGPPQLVGPIVLVPGWIHAYQPGFNPLGGYGMFPGVAGTGEGF